jgi:hypothetical protein
VPKSTQGRLSCPELGGKRLAHFHDRVGTMLRALSGSAASDHPPAAHDRRRRHEPEGERGAVEHGRQATDDEGDPEGCPEPLTRTGRPWPLDP